MHWADKQKPLQEVAGELGVFPEAFGSPPLVPEETDQETALAPEEVSSAADSDVLIERLTIEEHFLRVELVPAQLPERRTTERDSEVAF